MIPVADVQKQVLSQLYGSSKLLQVKPGKFDFYFTYGASKKVPVVFRGKITTSKSYYLAHTDFFPSTVTVYANKRQLDEVQVCRDRTFLLPQSPGYHPGKCAHQEDSRREGNA